MFTFDSNTLALLFNDTYHQSQSVRLVISSQEGLFLEFQNRMPGQLFYRKERIPALEFSGGSTDPGVQVELRFGQIFVEYNLTVDDPDFFSAMTDDDKIVVLSVRGNYQLKRKKISWVGVPKLRLFTERINRMRISNFSACCSDDERARWFGSAASLLEEAMFTDGRHVSTSDRHDFYYSRQQLRLRLNSITADGKIISSIS